MARSSSGRSVARAAATGGGTTYRGQMPVNWYAALVVIVLLGLGSVAFARYDYGKTTPAVQPTVGQTWHAGLAFDICGTTQPALTASPQGSTSGLTTTGSGVLLIAPKSSSEAGNNATLGKFASEYSGLTLTNTALKYPTGTELVNGDTCAKGTPDAGKKGEMRVRTWVLSTKTSKNNQLEETGGSSSSHPKDLKLQNRQLITVGFVPAGASLPKPPGSTSLALIGAISGTTPVTSTTIASTPSTTTPTTGASTSTTTTKPASTSSTSTSTTTTKPASTSSTSTSTTKPST